MKDNAKKSNPVDMNDAAEALTFSSAGLSQAGQAQVRKGLLVVDKRGSGGCG